MVAATTRRVVAWCVLALLVAACDDQEAAFCKLVRSFADLTVDVTELERADQVCLDRTCVDVGEGIADFGGQQILLDDPRRVDLVVLDELDEEIVTFERIRLPRKEPNGLGCDPNQVGGEILVRPSGSLLISADEVYDPFQKKMVPIFDR